MTELVAQLANRSGTAAAWLAADPVLDKGELGYNEDTGGHRIGDGSTQWSDLPEFIPSDQIDAKTADNIADPDSATTAKLSETFVAKVPAATGIAATDTAAILALTEAAHAAGGGRLIYPAGEYHLSAAVPIYDAVQHEGVPLHQVQDDLTPGTYLADDVPDFAGGTVFVGDGTFPAFTDAAVDLAAPTTDSLGAQKSGVRIYGIAFDNFTTAIKSGAKNVMGVVWSSFDQLYAKNCGDWAYEFVNYVHCDFGLLAAYLSNGYGRFAVQMDAATYQGGNSVFRELYGVIPQDSRDRRLCKGWRFEAAGGTGSNGGAMNEVVVHRLQANTYNMPLLSETATFTSGSASVTIADGTKYRVGMLVNFTTTVAGFTAVQTYVVLSVAGNTITLGNSRTAAAISASAAGTATIQTYGFAPVEVVAADANSHVTSFELSHVDSEGSASAAVYIDGAQRGKLDLFSGPIHGALNGFVVRNTTFVDITSHESSLSTDFDNASQTTTFTGARSGMVNRLPRGNSLDAARTVVGWQIGPGQAGQTIPDLESGIQGFIRPNSAIGKTIRQRDAAITLNGLWSGTLLHSSATAHTYTLPTITDAAPNSSQVGMVFEVVNVGAGTVTVATDGTQLFNKVAAKTSITVAQGAAVHIVAVKDGTGTLFWLATTITLVS